MKSILIACLLQGKECLGNAVGDRYALSFAFDFEDAVRQLQTGCFDLLLGSTLFDDSRLLELLPIANHTRTPVLVLVSPQTKLEAHELEVVRLATLSSGCSWIDYRGSVCIGGRPKAHQLLRQNIASLLAAHSPASGARDSVPGQD